jgi:hypothetical protein
MSDCACVLQYLASNKVRCREFVKIKLTNSRSFREFASSSSIEVILPCRPSRAFHRSCKAGSGGRIASLLYLPPPSCLRILSTTACWRSSESRTILTFPDIYGDLCRVMAVLRFFVYLRLLDGVSGVSNAWDTRLAALTSWLKYSRYESTSPG